MDQDLTEIDSVAVPLFTSKLVLTGTEAEEEGEDQRYGVKRGDLFILRAASPTAWGTKM